MGNQAGSLKKHIETAEKTGEPFVTLIEITKIETAEKTGEPFGPLVKITKIETAEKTGG